MRIRTTALAIALCVTVAACTSSPTSTAETATPVGPSYDSGFTIGSGSVVNDSDGIDTSDTTQSGYMIGSGSFVAGDEEGGEATTGATTSSSEEGGDGTERSSGMTMGSGS